MHGMRSDHHPPSDHHAQTDAHDGEAIHGTENIDPPDFADATIGDRKISSYFMNPEHPSGSNKFAL